MTDVRTRFAPSPTGYLHVGGIRTALFAFLLARQSGGQFVLRLEDTDKKREVIGSAEHLMASLRALGLNYDEGPDIGGPHAPYRQSERLQLYQTWAEQLIADGRAYADPYTPDELNQFREQARASKQPFLYRNHRPSDPPKWDGTKPLRFKSDPKPYQRQDAVMGLLSTGPEAIDDFILIKSDGYPTYNFAHIIDDADMGITHIIRGQEFLASMPNYLNLYEALGVTPPIMATMPHVLGPSGTKKLSKRDGAKDVLDYLRDGYVPEALVNFIATLGWNDATEQEIFTVHELIDKFRLDHVQRAGAHFDEQRLLWMNGSFIRQMHLDELYERATNFWPPEAEPYSPDYKKQVLGLIQERLKYFGEIPELTRFFFIDLPVNPQLLLTHKQLKKYDNSKLIELLEQAVASLEGSNFDVENLQSQLNSLLTATGEKPAVMFSLIRIATTQASASPGLAESLAVLGKDRSLKRIQTQIDALSLR